MTEQGRLKLGRYAKQQEQSRAAATSRVGWLTLVALISLAALNARADVTLSADVLVNGVPHDASRLLLATPNDRISLEISVRTNFEQLVLLTAGPSLTRLFSTLTLHSRCPHIGPQL